VDAGSVAQATRVPAGPTYRRAMDSTRVSDAERERTAELLRTAVGDGRLDLAEFDERLRRAYAAVTRADLADVTRDLPAPVAVRAPERPAPRTGEWVEAWRHWLGGSLVMLAIWGGISLAAGEAVGFWPAIPISIWAAVNVFSMITGQRMHGGCGGR
jgi:hypothetical protein